MEIKPKKVLVSKLQILKTPEIIKIRTIKKKYLSQIKTIYENNIPDDFQILGNVDEMVIIEYNGKIQKVMLMTLQQHLIIKYPEKEVFDHIDNIPQIFED